MKGTSYLKLILITGFLFLLTACGSSASQVPDGFYSYNSGKVEPALNELTFKPEMPDYIPVHMVSVVSDIYKENNKETMDISFYTEQNDLLSLTFTKGSHNKQWVDPQPVKIDPKIEGTYEDNQFAKRLSWKKNGITYTLAFRESVSSKPSNEQSVTKEHLIEVARSFHL